MGIRAAQRTVIDGWIRTVRLPIDLGTRLVPNGDHGPRNGVQLAVDRVDASIRATLGRLLNDDELQSDALRRRAAADERARAIELRLEAEQRKAAADRELTQRQENAEQLRERASQTAAEREQQAERERQERKQQVRQIAEKREAAVDEARDAKERAADQKAKRERLRVLDQQAEAVDSEADALTATDEAQRLATAAATAKARRKASS